MLYYVKIIFSSNIRKCTTFIDLLVYRLSNFMTSRHKGSCTFFDKVVKGDMVMVFNATFNNISFISWRSVLL
jgi:hypothetical protein